MIRRHLFQKHKKNLTPTPNFWTVATLETHLVNLHMVAAWNFHASTSTLNSAGSHTDRCRSTPSPPPGWHPHTRPYNTRTARRSERATLLPRPARSALATTSAETAGAVVPSTVTSDTLVPLNMTSEDLATSSLCALPVPPPPFLPCDFPASFSPLLLPREDVGFLHLVTHCPMSLLLSFPYWWSRPCLLSEVFPQVQTAPARRRCSGWWTAVTMP